MKFSDPLAEGHFVKRYKRFFAEIEANEKNLTAHVPNTGSLKTCLEAHSLCRYTFNDDPKRKLKYTLQMIKTKSSWVGVNTGNSNKLVWEAFEARNVPHWKKFKAGRREVKISDKSRIDLVLWKDAKAFSPHEKLPIEAFSQAQFHFVEVKNVTMAKDKQALFPDAVTTRGQKHILELVKLIEEGHTAELLFTVQRSDCDSFSPADDIDPEYGKLLREAKAAGLRISAYPCKLSKTGIQLRPEAALKLAF